MGEADFMQAYVAVTESMGMRPEERDRAVARIGLIGALQAAHAPCVVAMGTFDAVHAGHRAVVASAKQLATERGLVATAVTFWPRPERVFRADTALPDVCSLDERRRRLLAAGADRVVVCPFSVALAAIPAHEFVTLLAEHLGMRALCVGEDFALGARRAGTPEHLRALGVDVHTTALVRCADGSEKASSTGIRQALAAGASTQQALAVAG
jgi:riboflavin kinase/FMN adenylyltransferase